jgi:hypothetical protein
MNRRSTLMLTGITLGLAVAAFPQVSFAQSDPFMGTWQLSLAKSKYSPVAQEQYRNRPSGRTKSQTHRRNHRRGGETNIGREYAHL